jgi:3-oxoacyl-[acyl-carrier-protein] synthase II
MNERSRRVVVTGMGAVTPLASNVEDAWQGMLQGRSGVDYTTIFDASTFPTTFSGQVKDESVIARFEKDGELKYSGRNVRFALVAGRQAFEDARLHEAEIERSRFGVYLGAGEGPPDWVTFGNLLADSWTGSKTDTAAFLKLAVTRVDALRELFQEPNIAAGILARWFSALGPNLTCLTACAASAQAIGEAGHVIRRGDADVMIAGGAHSMINPFSQAGFNLLTALSRRNDDPKRASRPFDKERDGFVLSEGSAMLVLEELRHAEARGARIHGELLGYGTTGDAFRLTDMHPEGRSAKSAMRMALDDAGVAPGEVDYINAHGTSTSVNDKIETVAIKDVFGEHAKRIPVSSIKSMIGHLIASAGAIEAIACLLAIRDQMLPPTTNYENPDPELDLDYVPNVARKASVRVALSNSFGFGGQNVALVFGRYPM